MLDQAIKNKVTEVFSKLKNQYTLAISVSESHSQKNELLAFLNDVASCSNNINTEIIANNGFEFDLIKNSNNTGIKFKAIPTGHEFPSLLTALLNLDGIGKNLPDEMVINKIQNLKGNITLKSYISLTCTNCPEVVQALNILSIYNKNISHEIIDGALYKQEVDSLAIQAVPSVYANNELLHIGRSSIGELLTKLEKQVGINPNTQEQIKKEYDVIVVGGGPAGVSSAIYSARKGLKVGLVAEKVGGQVTETVSIENLISVPKTTGAELTSNLLSHLQDYPIDILANRRVESLDLVEGNKQIKTSLNETILAPALIVSTGASWRKLGIPGESEYIGAGVAFCTHCDGPFYKNKKVVVVGGGNSGLEAAIDLSSIAEQVSIIEFMSELKGDQVLQDKIKELPNVTVITNSQTLEINGDGTKVISLKYKSRETEIEEVIDTDGVFVQIGLKANSDVFSDTVKTSQSGEIKIDEHCRTNIAGIYAAGDVSVVPYKQIIIAMGEGSKAALSAFEDRIKNKLLVN